MIKCSLEGKGDNLENHKPIYLLVSEELADLIESGKLKAGDKLPSESQVCQQYGISRMTVRQAIGELINQGIVESIRGKGTFVTKAQSTQKNLRSFTETIRCKGAIPTTKVLEFSTVTSLTAINNKLGLGKDDKCYKLKRLRFADNEAVALETAYIPVKYCVDLDKYDLSGSLYSILEKKYNYKIAKTNSMIEANISSTPMNRLFERAKAFPMLKVTSVVYTNTGENLFYEEAYYDSKSYKYQVDITGR